MELTSGLIWGVIFSLLFPFVLRYLYNEVTFVGNFRPSAVLHIGNLEITIDKTITFSLKTKDKNFVGGSMLDGLPASVNYTVNEQSLTRLVVTFEKYAKLTVTYSQELELYNVETESLGCTTLGDSFTLDNHWFGAGHVFDQPWPLENWNTELGPFITGEAAPFTFGIYDQYYGGLQERYWLCSTGIALWVDFDAPLFVSTNYKGNRKLELVSKHSSPYQNNANIPLKLSYKLLHASDARTAHMGAIQAFFAKPTGIPSKEMFTAPIWSTWAQYKTKIDQDKVLEFAGNITKHGFESAQIEIDDDWTPHYGDFDFDKTKFPDPKKMVDELKSQGYRVMLWMHPFVSPFAKTFWDKRSDGFWVQWKKLNFPAIVSWWNGYAAEVDVTDPSQTKWYKDTLQYLQEKYGIDSFKFDAGDAIRLSTWTECKTPLDNPNYYTKIYAELCAEADTELKAQELRVGTGVQHLPMFFRLQDKDSNWGTFNGLKTVIPHVLTQGLIGYPFVLPDMIGGNAYAIWGSAYPERELYIRWVQLNAFLPSMQFSVVPWQYDAEVIKIAQDMCKLHKEYSGLIIELAQSAVKTGFPIVRPVWWLDPTDNVALTIGTEYLLGDSVLVAPVLDKGARQRDVYLPKGLWKNPKSQDVLEGKQWIKNYPAPIEVLPYFLRVEDD